jgi:trehalose utilization protein
MHGPIVPVTVHDINQEHPITKGIKDFETGPDEAFSAIMLDVAYTPLFKIKQIEPPLDALGGWCLNQGKGRIVVLFPGHNANPYLKGPYKKIMWGSAHWALNKDVPPSSFADGYKCGNDPVSIVEY